MTTPVRIEIQVDDQGSASVTTAISDNLGKVKSAVEATAGNSSSGMGSMVQGAADMMSAFNALSGGINQGVGLIATFNALGDASRKSRLALDTLSNGASSSFLADGRSATRGLVNDMDLATLATDGLTRGAFATSEQFSRIAKDGTVLGSVLGTDAAGGVKQIENALEMVGNSKALKPLGLDIQEVNKEYKAFLNDGMEKTAAWKQAVLDASDTLANKLGPIIDSGPGAAMTRLTTKWENFKASFAERVSVGIDSSLNLMETVLNDPRFTKWLETQITGGSKTTTPGAAPEGSIYNGAGGGSSPLDQGMAAAWSKWADDQAKNPTMTSPLGPRAPGQFQGFQISQNEVKGVDYSQSRARNNGLSLTDQSQTALFGSSTQDDTTLIQSRARQQQDSSGYTYQQSVAASQADVTAIQTTRDRAAALRDATAAAQSDMEIINIRAQAQQDATAKDKERVASLKSVADAFNLSQNGFDGQIGGTMDAATATARAARLAEDQHKGMGASAISKDMAGFDKQAQAAQDQYAISTGAATKESLAFRDAQQTLADKLAAGKIGITQYYESMQRLADIAKTGKASVSDFTTALYGGAAQVLPGDAQQNLTRAGGNRGDGNQSAGYGVPSSGAAGATTTAPTANPFASMGTSAVDATLKVKDLGTSVSGIGTNLDLLATNAPLKFTTIANSITPTQTAADKVAATLKSITDVIGKLNGGTLVITGNYSVGGGTARSGQMG